MFTVVELSIVNRDIAEQQLRLEEKKQNNKLNIIPREVKMKIMLMHYAYRHCMNQLDMSANIF